MTNIEVTIWCPPFIWQRNNVNRGTERIGQFHAGVFWINDKLRNNPRDSDGLETENQIHSSVEI